MNHISLSAQVFSVMSNEVQCWAEELRRGGSSIYHLLQLWISLAANNWSSSRRFSLADDESALSCWQIFSKNRLRFIISIQAGSWWELASEPMNILNSTCPSQPAIELMVGAPSSFKLTVSLPLILLNIIIIIQHSDHPYYVRPCPVSSLRLQNII